MRTNFFIKIVFLLMYYTEGYSQLSFQYASNQNISDKNEHLLEGYYPRKKLLSSSKKNDIFAGIYYLLGVNIPHKMQWESLENFFQYYNQTVQPNLLEPLGNNLKYKAAFSHGIEFFIQVLTMNVLWSKVKAQTTATLKNQDQRIIDLDFTHINFGFDIVMPIQRIFGIGVVMGLHQLKGEFSSGYKYHQNGYISYAQDKVFNGIYSTRSAAQFNYGARINLNFKFVTLVLKAQKMISPKDSQTEKLLPLYDKLSSTATGGSYYSDGEIPQNFSFAPNPNTNYKNLYKMPSGWIFSVSIGIGITNLHDN